MNSVIAAVSAIVASLCSRDVPTIGKLVDCADNVLFKRVLDNPLHALYSSLPTETVSFDGLRRNRELSNKTSRLAECSFVYCS